MHNTSPLRVEVFGINSEHGFHLIFPGFKDLLSPCCVATCPIEGVRVVALPLGGSMGRKRSERLIETHLVRLEFSAAGLKFGRKVGLGQEQILVVAARLFKLAAYILEGYKGTLKGIGKFLDSNLLWILLTGSPSVHDIVDGSDRVAS